MRPKDLSGSIGSEEYEELEENYWLHLYLFNGNLRGDIFDNRFKMGPNDLGVKLVHR